MAKFAVNFDGIMDRLEELELENMRLHKENAAMRPIVEAVAEAHGNGDVCDTLCSITFYDSEAAANGPYHNEPCIGVQAQEFAKTYLPRDID